MDFEKLFGFAGIVKEAFKIFTKNGKVMAFLTFLFISFCSLLYLSIFYSIHEVMKKMFIDLGHLISLSPQSLMFFVYLRNLKEDTGYFLGVEWIVILVSGVFGLILATATIIASTATSMGRNISIKGLFLSTSKSLKKPFVTWFYITLFGLGYAFLLYATLLPPFLILENPFVVKAFSIVLVILAMVLASYISVVWSLSLIVSVLEEENYGIEALGKAAKIVKGTRVDGFIMNLLFISLSLLLALAMNYLMPKKPTSTLVPIAIGLLFTNFAGLFGMFHSMAFTVFYYNCKRTHGEEVELSKEGIEYSEIPKVPMSVLSEKDMP